MGAGRTASLLVADHHRYSCQDSKLARCDGKLARCEQRLVRAAKMAREGEAAGNGRVGGRGVYDQQSRISFRDQMKHLLLSSITTRGVGGLLIPFLGKIIIKERGHFQ